jgi:uncharacterized phage protein (TIGR02218 family)
VSKTIPIIAHYEGGSARLAYGLKITRPDDQVFGFTSADILATISGVDYDPFPGLSISNIVTTAGLGVDNLELQTIDDGVVFTREDILSKRWNNSAFEIIRYRWDSPASGSEPILAGTLGEVTLKRGAIRVELRGLQQYLQQPVGAVSSKTCRNRLAINDGYSSFCNVDLSDFTYSGQVSEAPSAQFFISTDFLTTDSDGIVDDGWFDEGLLTWTTGLNAGDTVKVKTHASGGFMLSLPMFQGITVGDQFVVSAGCRKRLEEDCRDKFDSVLDFNGEPHRPKANDLIKPVEPGV